MMGPPGFPRLDAPGRPRNPFGMAKEIPSVGDLRR
jgi:hypothetical protein